MRILLESHLHAVTVLEGDFGPVWRDLLEALSGLRPVLRASGPFNAGTRPKIPKRQRVSIAGRRVNLLMPVDQSSMNALIDQSLVDRGWRRQPYILVDRAGHPIDTRLKADFEKEGLLVEVEFGNTASLFRDLFKFHIAGTSGAATVGVIVLATAALARFFDQGVATYEQAVSLLPYMRVGLQLPTAIVGIEVEDWQLVRDRYEEMRAVVEAEGEACHAFDTAMAMPLPEFPAPEG